MPVMLVLSKVGVPATPPPPPPPQAVNTIADKTNAQLLFCIFTLSPCLVHISRPVFVNRIIIAARSAARCPLPAAR
ncbi:MAG TPA: hypothetical protein VFK88_04395, partial [Gallionella sp.]|nr:hypothetical protein [Gallionella sp.]